MFTIVDKKALAANTNVQMSVCTCNNPSQNCHGCTSKCADGITQSDVALKEIYKA